MMKYMETKSETGALSRPELIMIAALGEDGCIGRRGDMPWHLPEDLKHFKETTMGCPVLMGRATWDSLPRRPLPGRANIVLTRNAGWHGEGAEAVNSLGEAFAKAGDAPRLFVIGGASLYGLLMPEASRLILTRVDTRTDDGDTFFPEIDPKQWKMVAKSETLTSKTGLKYRFEEYERNDNK